MLTAIRALVTGQAAFLLPTLKHEGIKNADNLQTKPGVADGDICIKNYNPWVYPQTEGP